jgi:excisionase family DNA binding protein
MSPDAGYTCPECSGFHWHRWADDIAQRAAAVDRIRQSDELAVSLPEAARLLGIGKTLMREIVAREEIPACKIGSRTVIRRAALEAWLEQQEAGGAQSCHENDPLVEKVFGETRTAPAASTRRASNGARS